MKRLLLILLAVVATAVISVQAATKYEINVGGVEVTSSNASNVTGGDIKSGTVTYNSSTKTLTLTNVTITRTGGSNYGIHNRNCDGLTMRFVGTCNVSSNSANALHLDKTTNVVVTSGSTLNAKITAGENYGRGVIYVNNNAMAFIEGPGTLNIEGKMKEGGSRSSCATCGFEGTGKDGNSWLEFSGGTIVMDVTHDGIYKFKDVTITSNGNSSNVDVKINFDYGFRALDKVGNLKLNNNVKCVTPADATFNSNDGSLGGNDYYTHFTNMYAVIVSTANFPDANFRSAVRAKCGIDSYSGYREHYFTSSQLQNLTSLDVSSKSISSLTGVGLLSYLTSLNCSNNSLTSLPSLPSGIKDLTCYNNQLTSLPTLPNSLEYLDVDNNKFSSLSITGITNLKYLRAGSNTSLTSLYCRSNGLTSLSVNGSTSLTNLDCASNALNYLNVSGCSSMTTLKCTYNQLTSLPTLPSSLQTLYCSDNKLTSLPSLPSTLTYLDCGNNQITSLPSLPINIEYLYAHGNKLTSVNTLVRTKLKLIYLANNSALTTLIISRNYALTSLTLSSCPALKTLSMQNLSSFDFSSYSVHSTVTDYDCGFNNLTSLPSLPSGLKVLRCIGNKLTSLPTLPSGLEELYCGNNKFASLSVTGKTSLKTLSTYDNTSMTTLNCNNNALTSLDISGCTALTSLDCSSNKFTSLPTLPNSIKSLTCHNNLLTSLPNSLPNSLEFLNVNNNKFTTLTITDNSNLKSLYAENNSSLTSLNCSDNVLTTLQFGGSPLTTLNCSGNQLTSLNVNNLNELTSLRCSDNKLTSLNVSANSKLEELKCHRNVLTSLNMQGLAKLKDFSCGNNKLTSLSVQGCTALSTQLNITTNQIKGAEMTSLINSMYTVPSGVTAKFHVFNQDNASEGNVITDEQIRLAKAKNWHLYKYHNGNWEELTASAMRGDLNGDGAVDVDDMNIVINIMVRKGATFEQYPAADLDDSGVVDIDDLNIIINMMVGKDPGGGDTQAAKTFTVNGVSFKMIAVEGGTFTMGATAEQGSEAWDDEKPAHQVTLSSYSIGETEVTQALWVAVMGSNPSRFTGNLQRPVEWVSWDDCQAFITKLNQLTGAMFRLPTEAEWEYAARGGNKSKGYKYAGSNTIGDVAWYDVNAYDGGSGNPNYGTHAVAAKSPNELGLYDMSGNVYEWCQDWFSDSYYSSSPSTNPTGPASGSRRVDRGGSWNDLAESCRVSYRNHNTPSYTIESLGLRLAL